MYAMCGGKSIFAAIHEAYYSGGYSRREVGEYLGHHYSWVSRFQKTHEQQRKTRSY